MAFRLRVSDHHQRPTARRVHRRGGILDVFPPDASEPRRIEWFDDKIESIRTFDTGDPAIHHTHGSHQLIAANEATREEATLIDFLTPETMVLVSEPVAALHGAGARFMRELPFGTVQNSIELMQRLQSFAYGEYHNSPAEGFPRRADPNPIGDVRR
jgi:transcription-repair coupling factor (superfamily II helicase)